MTWLRQLVTSAKRLGRSRSSCGKRQRNSLRVFEQLEARQLFAVAPLAPLGAKSTLLIPTGETPVHFFWDYRSSPSNDELGTSLSTGPTVGSRDM